MKYTFSKAQFEQRLRSGILTEEMIESQREGEEGQVLVEVDGGKLAAAISEKLLNFLAVEGRVSGEELLEEIKVNIQGDDLGGLIGSQGKTLLAFQQILSVMANKGAVVPKRVQLDAGDYWVHREEYLTSLARKVAQKAIREKREISLGPFAARERRIIHLALQGITDVYTESIGEEPQRFVVVKPSSAKSPR